MVTDIIPKFTDMETIVLILALFLIIVGLLQIIKLLRHTRTINSMVLKVLLKICEENNINIDIEDIQS